MDVVGCFPLWRSNFFFFPFRIFARICWCLVEAIVLFVCLKKQKHVLCNWLPKPSISTPMLNSVGRVSKYWLITTCHSYGLFFYLSSVFELFFFVILPQRFLLHLLPLLKINPHHVSHALPYACRLIYEDIFVSFCGEIIQIFLDYIPWALSFQTQCNLPV